MDDKKNKIDIVIVTPKDKDLWARCEKLEYDVFLQAGYIEPNPEKRIVDYDSYKEVEILAALWGTKNQSNKDKTLTGVYRYITGLRKDKMDFGIFPTIDAYKKLGISEDKMEMLMKLNPKKVVDTSSMAIGEKYRDYVSSNLLWMRMFTRAWELGIRYGVAAIDTSFFLKLKKRFPCEEMGPPKMYWGSYTTPTFIDSYKFAKGIKRLGVYGYRVKGLIKKYTQLIY